jgi:hypothetical protein
MWDQVMGLNFQVERFEDDCFMLRFKIRAQNCKLQLATLRFFALPNDGPHRYHYGR